MSNPLTHRMQQELMTTHINCLPEWW